MLIYAKKISLGLGLGLGLTTYYCSQFGRVFAEDAVALIETVMLLKELTSVWQYCRSNPVDSMQCVCKFPVKEWKKFGKEYWEG